MFFGIPQTYLIDIYEFYFEEYMLGYLPAILIMDFQTAPMVRNVLNLR